MSRKFAVGCLVLASLAGVGCGSDDDAPAGTAPDTGLSADTSTATDSATTTDGAVAIDSASTDSATDSATTETKLGEPKQFVLPLAPNAIDRLLGVAFAADGTLYATGTILDGTGNSALLLVKIKPTGEIDTTFGEGGTGIVKLDVVPTGKEGEVARGIAVQKDGKIVIAGVAEHVASAPTGDAGPSDAGTSDGGSSDAASASETGGDAGPTGPDPRDRDIVAARFGTDGKLDTTFGKGGKTIIDLSDGAVSGTSYVADSQWGLSLDAEDRLIIVGAQKAVGRIDSDFAVVRLTKDGAVDETFGTKGVYTLDIDQVNASPKTATIMPDGKMVISGYFRDVDMVVRPLLFMLDDKGAPVTTFGTNGRFDTAIYPSVFEIYAVAAQGDKLVTCGYGRASTTESTDILSLRFSADGKRDLNYGTSGVARVDAAGFTDNGRGVATLPDGRVILVGTGRTADAAGDGLIAVLTKEGQPDTTFAPKGVKLFDLGGATDVFWTVAVSSKAKLVAAVGAKAPASGMGTDDSAIVLVPIQ